LFELGTQKTDARVTLAGVPITSGWTAATPVSVILRHLEPPPLLPLGPKHPGAPRTPWPGQKFPAASVLLALPVVSGDRFVPRLTGRLPTKLSLGGPGGQSRVRPVELVVVHIPPACGPRLQVPWPGLLGEPVAEHCGHGCAMLPDR